jgi:16S rRNA C967 or C1407 C5-methylase (RsmB/RsmF family)/NOL1/NOP2/fmu family ribosome biogenesis protein
MELPKKFKHRMQGMLGENFIAFEAALKQPAPISVRVNRSKASLMQDLPKVPWAENAYYLSERPSFTLDPKLHAGSYYVQEASSMFLEQAIKQTVDLDLSLRVLDLCGAPGGKSTHLASLISKDSLLVSNEVIKSRSSILAENVTKWGSGNVVVTNNDPKQFSRLPNYFDLMVVDAPCSGEGMFRKDPQAMNEWSEENVNLCAQRQQRILADVWDALKPGGVLIYSTCTWNEQENEDNIAWLAKQEDAESIKLNVEASWGIQTTVLHGVVGYRFYPHLVNGEGFFISVLRKSGKPDEHVGSSRKKKYKVTLAGKKEKSLVHDWLLEPDRFEWLQWGEVISAIPSNQLDALDELYQNMHVVYAGVEVAEVKGKKLKPMHSLALSQYLNKAAFKTAELELDRALKYLRKEDITFEEYGNEWVLMQFRSTPIGWAKMIGNRINNYYPKEWRIRMELPEELPVIGIV